MEPQVIQMNVSENTVVFPMVIDTTINMGELIEHYSGEHVVTPSDELQTLSTEGYALDSNIIINPIPSNYGKITWNGSTLTVS